MAQKPSIPKGTRDFSPEEMLKRRYIFDTIQKVFVKYGYLPLETPTMENLTTLMGKYGEEGDKLLFKVLNSGEFDRKLSADDLENKSSAALATQICEKGLRYDLTVPFARYVVMHQNEINFPFKRYQIQPVWRADRPQKGRYREFYQCDVDVVGSNSLLNEVELIQMAKEVFEALNIGVTIKINNRKVLYGIAQTIGHEDKLVDITVAIDKLEKIGLDAVNQELAAKGLEEEAIETLRPILTLEGTNSQKLEKIGQIISGSEIGRKGVEELATIFNYITSLDVKVDLELDLSLARGLNYYTGAIFEVKAKDFAIGSITGGGRYDDLTGIFGLKGVSGVGISFGADRIYDVMNGLSLYPQGANETTKVMFVNFGANEELESLKLLSNLRESGVSAEIYPDSSKMKKQMDYANRRRVPYVVIIGESELQERKATIKNMIDGNQDSVEFDEIVNYILQKS